MLIGVDVGRKKIIAFKGTSGSVELARATQHQTFGQQHQLPTAHIKFVIADSLVHTSASGPQCVVKTHHLIGDHPFISKCHAKAQHSKVCIDG